MSSWQINDSALEAALRQLADDPALREHMGIAGRRELKRNSLQANAPRLARWFDEVAGFSRNV